MKNSAYLFIGLLSILNNLILWFEVGDALWIRDVVLSMTLLIFPSILLALFAMYKKRSTFMYLAFLFSMPIGLFLIANEGWYQISGGLEILYLISALFMPSKMKIHHGIPKRESHHH